MTTYAVYVIVKVQADDSQEAEAMAADAIGCIPDSVISELADDPYILKTELAD